MPQYQESQYLQNRTFNKKVPKIKITICAINMTYPGV